MAFDISSLVAGATIPQDVQEADVAREERAGLAIQDSRPPNGKAFRVHPFLCGEFKFYTDKLGQGKVDYLVADQGVMREHASRFTTRMVYLYVTEDRQTGIWVVSQHKDNGYCETATDACEDAKEMWVDVHSNLSDQVYEASETPEAKALELGEPVWPTHITNILEAVAAAIGEERIITDAQHPVVQGFGRPLRRWVKKEK